MEHDKKKDAVVTLAVLLVVVLVVIGAVAFNQKNDMQNTAHVTTTGLNNTAQTTPTTTNSPQTLAMADANTPSAPTSSPSQPYKNGTYTATGSYDTPENAESITVTVTIKDGTVTDTSATASQSSRDSREYSSMFLQNYRPLVIGKNISGISLSHVSGSSLTSQGFNSAIQQIKSQASS